MTENKKNKEETNVEETSERFYNTKAMVLAVASAGFTGFLLGNKRGMKFGYIQGLKDGIVQGLGEGQLEGYVNAISDVASVMRSTEE